MTRSPFRLLRAFLVTCLLAAGSGCATDEPDPLVVLGPWTGAEGAAFEETLKALDDGTGREYTYEGTRSLRETLLSQMEADDPPDVAILNSIGELTEYARRDKLRPLAGEAADRAYSPWAPPLIVNDLDREYWVPLKVDLKSLVWSRKRASDDAPTWCVGLGSDATSGWPGTDWIEDILLHQQGPDFYERWATGRVEWNDEAVKHAWTTWARLLGDRSRASVERSLTTSFEGGFDPGGNARRGLLDTPGFDCTHEHQSAFVRYLYGDDVQVQPAARFLDGQPEHDGVYEVAGDMAAVFSDDPGAQELVERLSSPEGRQRWRDKAGPAVRPLFPKTAGAAPTGSGDPVERRIHELLTEEARTLCFDASDVMPPILRDAFHRAVLEFFRNPADARLDRLLEQLEAVRDQMDEDYRGDDSFQPPDDICASQGG
ncbi:extracellular solute-binding protein [Streptomyces poonensis]|uniref:Alpha-glucoside transport system substrate-binding protein n=1 Tax=Streptomyces poonensis TaxID=68255 RepID=A0A918Q780_9ACTN|nr:extracellular solute-binding protein [Streptomyces poonensis]GGZ35779.1 hypothetical protein GCM10010365_65890 [Streptomyces poonensis]GLJ89650.1 hypothetical protein GCM10017589_22500 [Streptomyces poonensis]